MIVRRYRSKELARGPSEDEELFQKVFRYSNDAIFVIDPESDKILDVNPGACSMLNYPYKKLLSLPISAIYPQRISEFWAFTESVMELGHAWTDEFTCLGKTGQPLQSEISAAEMIFGGQKCIITMVRDVSRCKIAEENYQQAKNQLEFEKTRFEEVLSIEDDLSSISDLDKLIDFVVDKAIKILEVEKCSLMFLSENTGELIVKGCQGHDGRLVVNQKIKLEESIAGQVAQKGKPVLVLDIETDERFLRKNGSSYKSKSFISAPLRSEDHFIGVMNVTDKVSDNVFCEIDLKILNMIVRQVASALENNKYYRKLKQQAIIDPLTNIYNYRHFLERLDHEIDRLKRYSGSLCLLMIDVDDFKSYNDTYGHLEGDQLLREISKTLSHTLRKSDIVCRYAGDEFVAILPEIKAVEAEIVAEKVRRGVEDLPFKRKVTLSIGIGSYSKSMSRRDLILQADLALLKGKKEGKNRVLINR